MEIKEDNLKRAVIKEELVALTGDFKKAVLLNQLIYWSNKTKDSLKFIQEEKERAINKSDEIDIENSRGWIFKKTEEISSETMLGLSPSNISTHLKVLIENKWIDRRRNPCKGWDKTFQYRVNLVKIIRDLYNLGYRLKEREEKINYLYDELTKLVIVPISETETGNSEIENGISETEVLSYEENNSSLTDNKLIEFDEIQSIINSKTESHVSKTENHISETEFGNSETEPRSSETKEQYHRLLAEITDKDYTPETTTTKIDNEILHNDKSKEEEKKGKIKYVEEMLCLKLEDRQRNVIGTFDMKRLERSVALATTYTGKTNEEIIRILFAIYNNPSNHNKLNESEKIKHFNKYKKFSNYNQRTYDFEDLEKKLLGWDND